ncbi:MAG TPA: MFS transporter [Pyrinomonadaceae bacterium]|jgi:FSR family fosmidomycin resistance protein-like MFS transporter|nr:MFS transporter [Pyrinomonadaceae bacterium]
MSSARNSARAPRAREGASRNLRLFIITLLAVEFLDELVFGVRETAWPLIRDDLRLTYTQVGIVLSAPVVFGNLVEPALGILADVWRRRVIVLAGGVVYAAATAGVGLSPNFAALLIAACASNPASGAFVGLSQATLMDAEPARREQNMARWTLAGSLGNSAGPAAVGLCVWAGLSWRWNFIAAGALMLGAVALARRHTFEAGAARAAEGTTTRAAFAEGVREALRALRRRAVLRWLLLLKLGDFTYDVLRGFLALYFVDVVGAGEARAALAVVVWTWVGLAGDFLLLPLLERVRGLSYLRVSTSVVSVLFPAMLLAEGFAAKLALLGMLGFANAGWYAILKAQLYEEMPGRSGTTMTLSNVFGLFGGLVPLALGAFAQRYGLGAMMWLLAAGPLTLVAGLLTVRASSEPRRRRGA